MFEKKKKKKKNTRILCWKQPVCHACTVCIMSKCSLRSVNFWIHCASSSFSSSSLLTYICPPVMNCAPMLLSTFVMPKGKRSVLYLPRSWNKLHCASQRQAILLLQRLFVFVWTVFFIWQRAVFLVSWTAGNQFPPPPKLNMQSVCFHDLCCVCSTKRLHMDKQTELSFWPSLSSW